MLRLRAHHLICLLFYQGKGYSKDFTKNMDKIAAYFMQPDSKVMLVRESDNICDCCPNLLKNQCCGLGNEEIDNRDWFIFEAFSLKEEMIYEADVLMQHIKECLTKELFETICGICSWYEKGICCYDDRFLR